MSVNFTPHTWTAEEATSTLMNTEIKDPWTGIQAAWTSYTPAWTATTTNPAIGNGTITGAYLRVGKLIHAWARIVTGSTTTYGSGTYQITLPVAWNTSAGVPIALARYKSAASAYSMGMPFSTPSGLIVNLAVQNGSSFVGVTPTVPFTWSNGATLEMSTTYEAA